MSAAPPPPPPPYQPPVRWEPPAEPTRRGVGPVVLGVAVAAALAVGIGIGAVVGLALGSEDDDGATRAVEAGDSASVASPPTVVVTETETTTPTPEPTPEPDPLPAIPGDGDVVDGWQIVGKLDIHHDSLHDFEVRFRATNVTDKRRYDAFSLTILKKNEILAILDCGSYNRVDPGRIVTFECTTTDNYREGWTSVELTYDG